MEINGIVKSEGTGKSGNFKYIHWECLTTNKSILYIYIIYIYIINNVINDL